jgi:hypothetical protein
MSRTKRQQKQDERAIEQTNEILSGQTKVYFYDRPKKKAQANRIGGATGDVGAEAMAGRYMRILRLILPGILAMLSTVKDYRNPKKITHTLAVIMLYGILMFLSHTQSRREANREIGGSKAGGLMQELLAEFLSTPHADTLARLLKGIDEGVLEERYEELLKVFIKSDNFREVNPGRILVAADGTQKFSRTYCWDERALSSHAGDPGKERYYAYMLESVLVMGNGMVLPLLTETLDNGGHLDGNGKQDCETNAFKRLAQRIEKLLGKGCVTIVLDGLYATGPVMSICKNYGWEFMIVLKSECLKSVWEEFKGLRKIEPENTLEAQWGDRNQIYHWSNGIEYTYGDNHKKLLLNVVTCTESWYEAHPVKGNPGRKCTEYAWLSSSKVTDKNVFMLCTKTARYRWRIENHFLVLKHQGYSYTHCFSLNWKAIKGFHSLTKFANFINAFITYSEMMADDIVAEGIRGTIKKVWTFLRVNGLADYGFDTEPLSIINKRCKIRFRAVKLKKTA